MAQKGKQKMLLSKTGELRNKLANHQADVSNLYMSQSKTKLPVRQRRLRSVRTQTIFRRKAKTQIRLHVCVD